MKSRLARLGVIVAAVVALVGVTTPPAHANKVGTIAFAGSATVAGGLAYPCNPATSTNQALPTLTVSITHPNCPQGVGNVTVTVGHNNIPPSVTTSTLPATPLFTTTTLTLPNNPVPNTSTRVHGGRSRAFTFESDTCVGAGASAGKAGLPSPVETDASCLIVSSGVVNGWCGLSQAQGTATVSFAGRTYTITYHFNGIGGELVITGHVRVNNTPNHTSLVVGVVTAVPLPNTSTTPPGNSCAAGSATRFEIVGTAAFVIINQLP